MERVECDQTTSLNKFASESRDDGRSWKESDRSLEKKRFSEASER